MNLEIIQFENDDINPLIDECFSFSLMAEDYMDSIEMFYLAVLNGDYVGFLASGYNGDCILVEVKNDFRRQGIASKLVEKSKSFYPKQNGCPEFWDKVAENV